MKTRLIFILMLIQIFSSNHILYSQITSDSFEPFEHVNTLIPGKVRYNDVIKLIGIPDKETISQETVVGGKKFGGTKSWFLSEKGIKFEVAHFGSKKYNPIVDAISVFAPYTGMAANGLHIGLSKAKAHQICEENYTQKMTFDDTYFYTIHEKPQQTFAIVFSEDKVSEMVLMAELNDKVDNSVVGNESYSGGSKEWKTVNSFFGGTNENTDDFVINNDKFRIVWNVKKKYKDLEGGNVMVLLVDSKGEKEMIVNNIPPERGETIIRKNGKFYFEVTCLLANWEIEIQEFIDE